MLTGVQYTSTESFKRQFSTVHVHIQSSAAIMRYNITSDCIQKCSNWFRIQTRL